MSWALTTSQIFLVFDDLAVWRHPGQVFCRLSPNRDLCDVFLLIRQGLRIWGKMTTEVKCPSRHIIRRGHTVSMTYCSCCEPPAPGQGGACQVLHGQVALSPAPTVLFGEYTMSSLPRGETGATSSGVGSYINYLEFFCRENLPLLPQIFIYSVIYLCRYGFMDIYFIPWVMMQFLFNVLFLKLFYLWPLEALSLLLYPFDMSHHGGCFEPASVFFLCCGY